MSVVLVCLPNAPKVSEEAVRRDAELNKYLESRVEGENGQPGTMNQCSLCVRPERDESENSNYFYVLPFISPENTPTLCVALVNVG